LSLLLTEQEQQLGAEHWPAAPETLEALGIPESLVTDLCLRHIYVKGQTTIGNMRESLKLPPLVADGVFNSLRKQQLLDVKGMVGNDYSFSLTANGRAAASERFQVSQYAGPAPVSLRAYEESTRAQAPRVKVDRAILRERFSDLVLTDALLDQLGPAIISQNSIFLYGPTGNGKTSLAERLLRIYDDVIVLPYAVEVDGQIIILYDPVVHHRVGGEVEDKDPRWVVCKRPCITVGGELVANMLELRFDEFSGTYAAPLQMKSNNGIFIIDDFGRQAVSPRELLNRWIVPLDRRVDYLTLRHGIKFQIPFEMMVVFSTNLDPRDLADEAFLRRIQNKIYLEPVSAAVFDEIFTRYAAGRRMPLEPESTAHLRELCLAYSANLRGCYPADICHIVSTIGQYEKAAPRITRATLERAAALYFTRTVEAPVQ
jgi:hypothetical protein